MKATTLKSVMAVLMALFSLNVNAYDAYINGIYYNLVNNTKTAQVTYKSRYASNYSGKVIIPASVQKDGVIYSVTSIGNEAFWKCSGLTSVTIPSSVTSISSCAFWNCSGLTSVTIPNSVTSIGAEAFYNCSSLTSVHITDLAAWCAISYGNPYANPLCYAHHLYKDGEEIKDLTIPNDMTSINDYAFYGCGGLTSVTIPNSVTSIGYGAFSGCSGLTSVTIPNSVTSISNYAFEDCSSLTSVHITDLAAWCAISFGYLSNNPLYYAHHLYQDGEEIKDLTIPNDMTSINDYAFYGCSGLTSVTIPNSVTSIGRSAFYGCSGLTSVTIPNSVTSIGNGAFSGCGGLTSVTIGNSVTSISDYAFNGCTNLKSLTIGSGVTSIGQNAFTDSPPIKTIWLTNTPPSGYQYAWGTVNYVPNNQFDFDAIIYPSLSSVFEVDGIKYVPVSPSEKTCDAIDCVYNESAENINIGESVTNKGVSLTVKQIRPYLCYGNNNIKTVRIDVAIDIPQSAFYGCLALREVELGQNVTSIGNKAFQGCSSIQEVKIPKGVTTINDSVFSGCTTLKTFIMEDWESKLTLGSNGSSPLFADCPLDSVYIGRNITYSTSSQKGYSPFYRNTSLRSVIITDKETEISTNEFYGCTNLKKVSIGTGVATIGDGAFSDCTALTHIFSKASTPPVCGLQALDDINKWTCILTVPTGYQELYQMADQWKDFFFIEVESPDKYTLTYIVDGEIHKTYEVEYGTIITPEEEPTKEGYTFSGWSEIPETMPAHDITVTGTFSIFPKDGQRLDFSKFIINGDFDTEAGPEWTIEAEGAVLPSGTDCAYWWFGHSAGLSLIQNFSQTIKNMPAGNYLLDVNASIRVDMTYSTENYKAENLPYYLTLCQVYANDEKTDVHPFFYEDESKGLTLDGMLAMTNDWDYRHASGTLIDDMLKGSDYYHNYVAFHLEEKGDIKVGFRIELPQLCGQMPFIDYFHLYYYGDQEIDTGGGSVDTSTQNSLSINDMQIGKGGTFVFPVHMSNTEFVTALEFEMSLPSGITLNECKLSDRKGRDHTASFSQQMDGTYKVVAYSASSKVFSGTEGTVVNLMLEADKNMKAGEYTVNIKNIELTLSDATPVTPADISAKLTVSDIQPGDVNGSGKVTISDVVAIVNHVIGRTPANFVAAAADVNGDGLINVFDVTKTVNIILGIDGEEAKLRDAVDAIDGMMTMERKGDDMNLVVEKPANYVAMQFDMIVPEGSSLQDVKLNGCADHALAFDRTGENRYTVIAYSLNNAAFEATEEALVTLQLSDGKAASIENAAFVTTDGRCVKMNVSDMETGIQSVDSLHLTVDSDAIYTLSGQRVTMERKALPKGVYIQNGRKFVVK